MRRAPKIRRIHRSQDEIERIVEDYQSSKLSLSAYSKATKVPPTSLSTWVRKSRNKTGGFRGSSALIPVHLVEKKAKTSEALEVVLENRRIVRIYPGFDPDTLAQVLSVVEVSC